MPQRTFFKERNLEDIFSDDQELGTFCQGHFLKDICDNIPNFYGSPVKDIFSCGHFSKELFLSKTFISEGLYRGTFRQGHFPKDICDSIP